MEKETEIFLMNISQRNMEELITIDTRGLPHSVYQKRIVEVEVGG